MIISVILACVSGGALFWSFLWYHRAYHALIGSLPLELRDDQISHFAFQAIVLNRSTPLALQMDYLKSQAGICTASLAISLLCFVSGGIAAGWWFLFIFLMGTLVTIISWRKYERNCRWRASLDCKQNCDPEIGAGA